MKYKSTNHLAFVWVVEPLQQLNACAFPTATAAHKGQSLTGFNGHHQSVQDLDIWPSGIGEFTVSELHLPFKVVLDMGDGCKPIANDVSMLTGLSHLRLIV